MKKMVIAFMAILIAFSAVAIAGSTQKAKLGPCVRSCVHAFNPSLSDAGADEFLVTDFNGQQCVEFCKEGIASGTCTAAMDNCCNSIYLSTDPDCKTTTKCSTHADCATGNYCGTDSQCHALKSSGTICTGPGYDYECDVDLACLEGEPGQYICYTN